MLSWILILILLMQLSPCVRNSWIESDWGMLEELLPNHFWKSTSGRRKYNHWQQTFNAWVELEGSAPSIQIMKNVMEKIKKCVKSGSNSFKALVPALYEIACYITSTTCTAVVADLNRYPPHAQSIGQSLPGQFSKGCVSKLISRDGILHDSLPEAFSKDNVPQCLAWYAGQPPEKNSEENNEMSCQIFSTDIFDDGFTQQQRVDIPDISSNGAIQNWRDRSDASYLDNFESQGKASSIQCNNELGFDVRSLPSLTSSEIESLGTHLLPS